MTSGGKEEGSRRKEETKKRMATGIMDDGDAGYNPAEKKKEAGKKKQMPDSIRRKRGKGKGWQPA